MEEKIIGALASALNLDATELFAELKDGDKWAENATELLSGKISAQVKAAKEAQYKRGIREKGKAVEQYLRGKGFDNAEKLEGEALLEAAFEFLTPKGGNSGQSGEPAKMTKEDLLKLPEVKALIDEGKKQAGSQFEALKAEYDAAKTTWQTMRIKDLSAAQLPSYLDEAKVILDVPGSQGTKEKRVQAIAALIDWSKVSLNEKNQLIFIDEQGQPATDDFGKPLDFKKHVVGIAAEIYGVHKTDSSKGGAAPGGKPSNPGNTRADKYAFTDSKAFQEALFSEPDVSKRAQMRQDWKEQSEAAQQ